MNRYQTTMSFIYLHRKLSLFGWCPLKADKLKSRSTSWSVNAWALYHPWTLSWNTFLSLLVIMMAGKRSMGNKFYLLIKLFFSSTLILKVQEVVKQIPLPEKRKNSWRNDQTHVWSNKWCVDRERDIEEGKREHHIQNCIKKWRKCTYHHDVMKKRKKK